MKILKNYFAAVLFSMTALSIQAQNGWTPNGVTSTNTLLKVGIGNLNPTWPMDFLSPTGFVNQPTTTIGAGGTTKQLWFLNNVIPSFTTYNQANLSGLPSLIQAQDQALLWTDGQNQYQIQYPGSNFEPGGGGVGNYLANGNATGGFVLAPLFSQGGGIRIDGNGRVGISTANPTHALHVTGDAKFEDGIQGHHIYSSNWVNGWEIQARHQVTTPYLYVGNVTNTNTSLYSMEVCGKIRSKGLKVEAAGGWCDYVLDKSYKLMPLYHLEQYIKIYHHLPNIPSANEVKKDGVDVELSIEMLLRKIEELTLYTIQLQKQLDEQNKIINNLKK